MLKGDYSSLITTLASMDVGTLFLELCTERSGSLEILKPLSTSHRIGVGVVNQKTALVEDPETIARRIEQAVSLFATDKVLLNPDCGFATFADKPICSAEIAEAKLKAIAQAKKLFLDQK